MTGWIILAAVLAFFALILGTGIRCSVSYKEDKLSVKAGFWFFRFALFPRREEKKKKPKKKKGSKKQTKPQEEKANKAEKEKLDFETIVSLLHTGKLGFGILWRHLFFYNFRLRIVVGDEDAAECALRYGKICGYIHGGIAAAKNLANLKTKEISVSCDFSANRSVYELEAKAKIRVVFILGAALRMLFSFLADTMKKSENSSAAVTSKENTGKKNKHNSSAVQK